MPDGVYIPNVLDDLIGASVTVITGDDSNTYTIDESYIQSFDENFHIIQVPQDDDEDPVSLMVVVLNESYVSGTLFPRSIWLFKTDTMYVSSVYKEATTEEVVHQIDQKYIPGGSGGSPVEFVDIEWDGVNDPTASKTVSELIALGESGKILYARLYVVEGDLKELETTVIATTFGQGYIEFGHNTYSPSRDGNYPFIAGYGDRDEDEWQISL